MDVLGLDSTNVVDVVGTSAASNDGERGSVRSGSGDSSEVDIGINSVAEKKSSFNAMDEISHGLTSFHDQVSSPIGSSRPSRSFLDITGHDDFLPGRSVVGSVASSRAFDSVSGQSDERAPSFAGFESASAKFDTTSVVSEANRLLQQEHADRTYDTYGVHAPEGDHVSVPVSDNGRTHAAAKDNRDKGKPRSSQEQGMKKKKKSSTSDIRKKYLKTRDKVWYLTVISIFANVFLFAFKIYISITSHSLAVMASAVDSFLDLVSQAIIYYAMHGTRKFDEQVYPVGRNRLEPIGIIVCATLMGIASVQVIWESTATLIKGTIGGENTDSLIPSVSEALVVLMSSAIVIKLVLFIVCNRLRADSDSMMVLAEDHRNDVLSNSMALASAYASYKLAGLWWVDPAGGILISIYICVNWLFVAQEQAMLLEGAAAEPNFLEQVRNLSNTFHDKMFVDVVRAYHFGKCYLVEVEVALPGTMTVVDAHDISLDLQKKIERLENVERAFVHVDYQTRDEDEHKAAYTPTPNTSPSGMRADSDLESVTSSIDLEEEIQVLGDVFDKAKPGTTLKHHAHIRHHRSAHKSTHKSHHRTRTEQERPLLSQAGEAYGQGQLPPRVVVQKPSARDHGK